MKDLPYFKFYCNEWITGEITALDYDTQGLFVNICSYYWSKNCTITLKSAKKRFKGIREECYDELIESEVIKVVNENIIINFLDEQLDERGHRAKQNAINGAKGGRPKKQIESENKPTALISESETKAKKSNIEEKRGEEKRKEYNTIESIDFDELLKFINSSFGRSFKTINPKVRKSYNARLKETYTKEDFVNCITNLKNHGYHKENNYQYCTPEFISRSETLEKYSNVTNEDKSNKSDIDILMSNIIV